MMYVAQTHICVFCSWSLHSFMPLTDTHTGVTWKSCSLHGVSGPNEIWAFLPHSLKRKRGGTWLREGWREILKRETCLFLQVDRTREVEALSASVG